MAEMKNITQAQIGTKGHLTLNNESGWVILSLEEVVSVELRRETAE